MILRIGGGICFIGHGVLALLAKTGFVGLLHSFGLESEQAVFALKFIGCLDILVGLSLLFRPTKAVLIWAMLWTTLTIAAWGIHGDSIMDLARRVPYVTTPLALLFLLYRENIGRETGKPNEDSNAGLPFAPALAGDPPAALSRAQSQSIRAVDLSMICRKLMDPREGEGWSNSQCEEACKEYRRFLTLHVLFPEEPIVPNLAIDTIWHYHILDTVAYQRDCEAIFGRILHHYPYFGMNGASDERQFFNAFDRTKELYRRTFGSSMDSPDFLPSFRVRRPA